MNKLLLELLLELQEELQELEEQLLLVEEAFNVFTVSLDVISVISVFM